ncbi:phage head closure protein [Sphingomonas sp. HT-1]|uniref:phage head closure protein n=1 Tax=unclassified Sphingomonas TaxID=196159 RepID=UPI0002DE0E88|nr:MULTISPECIES: phage head closure protein [unclassified Sphingomonas]KTF70699.1 phage head-tail adaptor protein [Sphingomonas sp. WG]
MTSVFDPSKLNRRVRIERPVPDTSLDGAGSGTWELVKEVWAEVQDVLPSRGERLAEGINVAARPARVRIRYRDDVRSDMRLVLLRKGVPERIMQIVSGPATLGNRDGLELMVEDYRPAGNPA